MFIFYNLLLLALLKSVTACNMNDQCRELEFPASLFSVGERLLNHVIRTIKVLDHDNCELQCYLEHNCVSINFDITGKNSCDLNNSTHKEHENDLVMSPGYLYHGTKNTCAKAHCKNNATCQTGFTSKRYRCLCIPGFKGHDCERDINECKAKTHKCDVNAVCNNTKGSYNCTCKAGYSGDGRKCEDINECKAKTHRCDVNAVCNNTKGSYNCTCKAGYSGDGRKCEDINECTAKTHRCDVNAVCNNTKGSYNCTCKAGYSGDGRTCEDIDECKANNKCDMHAVCSNTNGSYNCTCQAGYSGDGQTCSEVIDNCLNHVCLHGATCKNEPSTDVSYTCLCYDGWTGNYCDTDIDECTATATATAKTHKCDANAVCTNTKGSYNCTCKAGYTGDGQNCDDIDECSNNSQICDFNAVCNNINGSYTCICKPGYTGDGHNCKDIDECAQGIHDCSKDAFCNNTEGSFNCTCKPGFTGDGHTCTDIDECTTSTHQCDANAECYNTEGLYNCTCKPGYTGDGHNCTEAFINSTILTNNEYYLRHLYRFIVPAVGNISSKRFRLCYRHSEHGQYDVTFHRKCDGKNHTITIIRENDYVFGGYTDIPWESHVDDTYGSTPNAFIFSLHNKEGLRPFKSIVKNPNRAICKQQYLGPTFGHDDIRIDRPNNKLDSNTNFGIDYFAPSNVTDKKTILAGTEEFDPDEVEVFYLN